MASAGVSEFRPTAVSWRRFVGPAARAVRARRFRTLALGPTAGLAIGLCAVVQHRWHPALLTYAASTPSLETLVRLPVSVVSPAEFLPAWGAIAQTVVGLAVAQALLGLRRTLVVALGAHVLATLGMRALVHLAAAEVPSFWLHEPDSGPSVAVLAALACAGVAARASWVAGLVVSGALLEVVVLQNQAGVEHLTGVAVGVAAAVAWRLAARRRSPSRRPNDTTRAVPPVPGRQAAAA